MLTARLDRKLEDWKQRLLDLTRRNPTLHFRPDKPFNLMVAAPDAQRLLHRLLVEEKKRHIFVPAPLPEQLEDGDEDLVEGSGSGDGESPKSTTPAPEDLVIRGRDGNALRRRLKALFRQTHADFEERALQTLYLACGLLRWFEKPNDECVSPILMVPVTIERDPERDTYTIGPADDEPVVNPSLSAKLAEQFRLTLPNAPEDWDSRPYDSFIQSFRKLIEPYKWQVDETTWLARFSFHKLSLYQDISSHADAIKRHPIVAALAGDDESLSRISAGNPRVSDESELDAVIQPQNSFTVLDADSSQLVCIEAVNQGHNIIVQGPPGTGKSQTIVNIIAQLLATGKSVLFVSEKIAALEVVYSRLKDAGLGPLCHELHSHKTNKREVVQELHRSLTHSLTTSRKSGDRDFQRLTDRRSHLNEYARAIGSAYDGMKTPLFKCIGELALLNDVEYVPYPTELETLTESKLSDILDQVRALQRVWAVVQAGEAYPWWGFSIEGGLLSLKSDLEAELHALRGAALALRQETDRVALALDLEPPSELTGMDAIGRLCDVLDAAPIIKPEWLTLDGDTTKSQLLQWLKCFEDRARELEWIYSANALPAVEQAFFSAATWSDECKLLKDLLGDANTTDTVLGDVYGMLEWVNQTLAATMDLSMATKELNDELGTQAAPSITAAKTLIHVSELASSGARPEPGWFNESVSEYILSNLVALRDEAIAGATLRQQILSNYDEQMFSIDVENLITRFAGEFRSLFRIFNKRYRASVVLLRALRRDGNVPKNIESDLRQIRDYLRRDSLARQTHAKAIELLGDRYKGAATDFVNVEASLKLVIELRVLMGKPSHRLTTLLAGGDSMSRAMQLSARLDGAVKHCLHMLSINPTLYKDGRLVNLGDELADADVSAVIAALEGLRNGIQRCLGYLGKAFGELPSGLSVLRVSEIANHITRLRELNGETRRISDDAQQLFGNAYVANGEPTWIALNEIADWLIDRAIVLEFNNATISSRLRANNPDKLSSTIASYKAEYEERVKGLLAHYKGARGQVARALDSGDLADVMRALDMLTSSIDLLNEWRDHVVVRQEFSARGFSGLYAALTERPKLEASSLEMVAKKTVLQQYIDEQFRKQPALRNFRGDSHSQMVSEFADLDRRIIADGGARVVELAMQQRPAELVSYQGSEVRVLLTEAGKKKGHYPIRKLFAKMPQLLRQLKPCLLMSPLSVSQFLDPYAISFDCVIFDEASQICSEDAVSAIYRGRQLAICGDKQQLPPTDFFKAGDPEEEIESDESEVAIFESVLAEAETAGFLRKQLRWHYRSAHESLIAFSNERFYNYSLITFPSPGTAKEETVVSLCHVPDAIYDRGGRRDNAGEAERVVQLVLEHIEKRPNKSLGVVAFSRPQADAIQNRIDLVRKARPDLAWFFSDERLNGFFVKNLERVQGDERDHIIFSIGYGRDKNGLLTMNFGPVGHSGGEKRLNVAVTRAREKVVVVSSIRAQDIDLEKAKSPGLLALHRYLDYAERGYAALDIHSTTNEYESPFEEDVAGEIRSLGYSVIPQIGVSTFRIDLGVIDPAQPGRFILGVECDGAMYHSSYTARDRDRLRQDILERKMGWRLHRIWSPDWIHERSREIERLKVAIENARRVPKTAAVQVETRTESDLGPLFVESHSNNVVAKQIEIVDPGENGARSWTTPYAVATISFAPLNCEFHEPQAMGRLSAMALEVAAAEGPVHKAVLTNRLARRWNLSRVGGRMVEAMDAVFQGLQRGGKIHLTAGGFITLQAAPAIGKVRVPVAGRPDTLRSIDQIAEAEIELCMISLLREAVSFEHDQLLVQTARTLGYDRTGVAIRNRLTAIVTQMIKNRSVVTEANRVFLIQ